MIELFEPVEALPVDDLGLLLGSDQPVNYPEESRVKDFHSWRMEVDDSPIFRYIYRNFRPRRHLEFGTWRGEGTCYVLDECEATVWTINPPLGERTDAGEPVYRTYLSELEEIKEWAGRLGIEVGDNPQTDNVIFIGMRYLMRDLGARVCQIYSDSRTWETTNFPREFFDSVLVDGGHETDVVINDTRKSLPLLRSGGIMMWHDFCPDDGIVRDFGASRGVVNAIREMADELRELDRLVWIQPSFILLGIKK